MRLKQKTRTHYDNLKVARNAPIEVIKAAQRALAKKYHPDQNRENPDATRIMSIINAAYEVLSDPVRRKEYDDQILQEELEEQIKWEGGHDGPEADSAQSSAYSEQQETRQDIAVAGFIYLLVNPEAVALKIGYRRHPGGRLARKRLNYDCVFKQRTNDCRRAIKQIYRELENLRIGRKGYGFFSASPEQAMEAIRLACSPYQADQEDEEIKTPPKGT